MKRRRFTETLPIIAPGTEFSRSRFPAANCRRNGSSLNDCRMPLANPVVLAWSTVKQPPPAAVSPKAPFPPHRPRLAMPKAFQDWQPEPLHKRRINGKSAVSIGLVQVLFIDVSQPPQRTAAHLESPYLPNALLFSGLPRYAQSSGVRTCSPVPIIAGPPPAASDDFSASVKNSRREPQLAFVSDRAALAFSNTARAISIPHTWQWADISSRK